ncbi:hypothetical protein [Streptomyces noursei]|uniref:hypothetical protein n=1 Tax=Streptomyces noursei TaxID=1971 RepID=UPI0016790E72|nr:hypothetical protein [Streptomyces noursei]MCZ1021298.1 hypothetical protein [Streptomyces noursei]GGX55688.1 hypothetical protein GCM10010341_90590 [Streptomyces noursei]
MTEQSVTTDQGPVIVPMTVQALMVNEEVRKRSFARWELNCHLLGVSRSPEPAPWQSEDPTFISNPENDGVYLQWELPQALRQGQHDTVTGGMGFPLVPNRWLVVRYHGTGTGRAADGWVVESDYLNRRSDHDDSSSYVHPYREQPTGTQNSPFRNTTVFTRIGRKIDLADGAWQEPDQTDPGRKELFLTALGPGFPTYHCFQPYNKNVFSLHDPLTGIDTADTISYLVLGWYSNPDCDLLAVLQQQGGDLTAALAGLGWSLPDSTPSGAVSKQSLYCGRVLGITWDGADHNNRPDPDQGNVAVAVGNTSDDAMGALAQQLTGSTTETEDAELPEGRLLQLCHRHLLPSLDGPDGDTETDQQVHTGWFNHLPGGYIWTITGTGDEDTPDSPRQHAASHDTADPDDEAKLLADLNTLQDQHDQAVRALAAAQQRLYDLWWMSTLPKLPPGYRRQDFTAQLNPQQEDSAAAEVQQLQDQITQLRQQIPWGDTPEELAAAIAAYATGHCLPADRQLKRAALPAFHQANDPVLILTNIRFGSQAIPLAPASPLPCRLPGDIVTAINVPDGKTSTVAPSSPPVPSHLDNLPPQTPALLAEFFLLDPANATKLAADLGWTDDTQITALTNAMANPAAAPNAGTLPYLIGSTWQQPWAPLYFEWEVDYYPVPQDYWEFDGNQYQWTKPYTGDKDDRITLGGRQILTPHIQQTLSTALRQYAQHRPPTTRTALLHFADQVNDWDLLAQTLNSFGQQLTARDPSGSIRPQGPLRDLIGTQHRFAPDTGPLPNPFTGWPTPNFQQIRGGQFRFTRLSVIDRFGQSVEIVTDNNYQHCHPKTSTSMTPGDLHVIDSNPKCFVQVTPRLPQPARLRFDLVNVLNDDQIVEQHAGTSPLAAWILPNYLDHALLCYAPDGTGLGEMRVVKTPGQQEAVAWNPLPDSPCPTIGDLQTNFPHLHSFADQLTDPAQGPHAFDGLMASIDLALQQIDPSGGYDDTNLGWLIGRPLALARVRLTLELQGAPVRDPSWRYALNPTDPDFPTYTWPVRLGQDDQLTDGLIGYFTENTYNQLNAVRLPANPPPYLTPIGTGANLQRAADGQPIHLTLLMDPRAAVHATTDILPATDITLPTRFIEQPLTTMQVAFRMDPLLTTQRPDTPTPPSETTETLIAPRPSTRKGTWTWAQYTLTGTGDTEQGQWTHATLKPADTTARLESETAQLRAGVLQLTQAINHTQQSTSNNTEDTTGN